MTEHTSKPNEPSTNTYVSLKEYFTNWIESLERLDAERDRRYEERHIADQRALDDAFKAAKEAVAKAESANEKRFDSVNEFRQSLRDQNDTFLQKTTADAIFVAYDIKIESLRKEIQSLRESRSVGEGITGAHQQDRTQANWSTGVMLTIIFFASGTIIGVVEFVLRATGH